ncbi:MAG: hypothetical protein KC620_15460 [Myxococcales bacterium]|nr:hypothetical protein [Myxococcales bacterium]
MRRSIPLWCLLSFAAGCDDEPASTAADARVDAAPQPDAAPMRDAAPMPDAALPDTALPDAAPDAMPCEPPESCPEGQRLVGCECLRNVDRRCITDADCRPEETCNEVQRLHICIYEPPPTRICPGPDCPAGADSALFAAAVSKVITPDGFEIAAPAGLDGAEINFTPPFGEGQWLDCGLDALCPDDDGYPGPDEGEGDGKMQGIWMAGFSSGRPATLCPPERIGCDGVDCCVSKWAHDDLNAQIVVIRQNGLTVAFAALDVVGFFHSDIERIREMVEPLGVDLLITGSTHSHEGPDTAGQWGPGNPLPAYTGRDPRVLQKIQAQVVDGIAEALGALAPANVQAGVIDTGVRGLSITDSRTPYIFNDDLPVVHLTNAETGAAIATMASFGMHAEVLWSDNQLLTADYFGFARKYIRQGLEAVVDIDGVEKPALPGTGGVVVFFAGTVGGLINPGRGGALDYAGNAPAEVHSFEAADAVGQTLAAHVLTGLRDGRIAPVEASGLTFATRRYLLPIANRAFQLASIARELIIRDVYNVALIGGATVPGEPMVQSQVAVVRLGPITWFTAPGEAFPESLVGGFPGRPTTRSPVIGDVAEHRAAAVCGADGLPVEGGDQPCVVRPDQENPPDWDAAPMPPYGYDVVPGEVPFFIGLGMDFLGYLVPDYDFQAVDFGEAPGDHYEESNSVGIESARRWWTHLNEVADAVR